MNICLITQEYIFVEYTRVCLRLHNRPIWIICVKRMSAGVEKPGISEALSLQWVLLLFVRTGTGLWASGIGGRGVWHGKRWGVYNCRNRRSVESCNPVR